MNIEELKKKNEIVKNTAAVTGCEPEQLPDVIRKLQREIKEFNLSMKALR